METLTSELTPLEGGHTGDTFLAQGPDGPTVVRLYTGAGQRLGSDAANIDAELLQWMRGLLPVPEVLEVRRPDADLGLPAILVTSHLPGTRADIVLAGLAADRQRVAAREIATLLQRLSMVRTPRAGSFEGTGLQLGEAPEVWRDLDSVLDREGRRLMKDWSASARTAFKRGVARAQELLDEDPVSCLVHGDFQPSNLLLDPQRLEVVGLVDWERALSGNRFTDLGRMLRASPGPAFEDALLGALDELDRCLGLEPVPGRLERARAADLVVLVERALQPSPHPEREEARRSLRRLWG